MLLSRITKYELEMPRDEKVEFTMEELVALTIWLVEAYHNKVSDLELKEVLVRREGEVIRIGDCKGCLSINSIIGLLGEMHTLMPYYNFPSEMSIPERTLNSVRSNNDILGYFDANNESLLPVGLVKEKDNDYYYVIRGKEFMNKSSFSRYQFDNLAEGQL